MGSDPIGAIGLVPVKKALVGLLSSLSTITAFLTFGLHFLHLVLSLGRKAFDSVQ